MGVLECVGNTRVDSGAMYAKNSLNFIQLRPRQKNKPACKKRKKVF